MIRFLRLALFCLLATPLKAGDAGLYPEAIDPNAGFLRVMAPEGGVVVIAGKPRRIGTHGLSDFQILPSGQIEVAWPQGQVWVDLKPGLHVSLMVSDDGTSELLEDTIANHPAKADVTLINVSDLPGLGLFVPQAKADIFSDLAPDQMETRALRAPLTLDFEFRVAGETVTSLSDINLRRKAGVTFVLKGSGGDYTALALRNRYAR